MKKTSVVSWESQIAISNDKTVQHQGQGCCGEGIASKIYVIRDVPVMLDVDLAKQYGVETKALNQAVKRNIERFPTDFMFRLTQEECRRSQIVTFGKNIVKVNKYAPCAFTECGIAMLSGVLRSHRAIEANIEIMRAFVAMRRIMQTSAGVLQRLGQSRLNRLRMTNASKQSFLPLIAATFSRTAFFPPVPSTIRCGMSRGSWSRRSPKSSSSTHIRTR